MKTIRSLDVRNKRVLVRVDYNVPVNSSGKIEDDTRIRETLPTIRYLLQQNAIVVLMSHLGRPKGKPDLKFSLRPLIAPLEALLDRRVFFVENCIGKDVEKTVQELHPGEILLLENLRFHAEEEKNNENFARALASLCDIYVNDAFAASHRSHASTVGVTRFIPSAAGFLLEKETRVLSNLLSQPDRPYMVILGGAKVSDKLGVLKNLLARVDAALIGGAMAFSFLKSLGFPIGKSLVEEDQLLFVSQLLKQYPEKIKLPVDVLAAPSLEFPEKAAAVAISKEKNELENLQGLDIGPKTAQYFSDLLLKGKPKTIFWNGPMGVFEIPEFSKGTLEVGKILARCAKEGANVVVGGGDSVAAIKELGLGEAMSHLSTGGGASLEFLEGKSLPGIACLGGFESAVTQ